MGLFDREKGLSVEICRFSGEGENVLLGLRKPGFLFVGVAALAAACATVKVEAPDEPIEINLNVNIQQEVRVKLEREVEDLIANNPDIF